jgi:hypothetical protein
MYVERRYRSTRSLSTHLFKAPDRCHGPAVTPAQIIPSTRANPNAAEKYSIKASVGNRIHVPWSYPTDHSDGTTGLVMCTEVS